MSPQNKKEKIEEDWRLQIYERDISRSQGTKKYFRLKYENKYARVIISLEECCYHDSNFQTHGIKKQYKTLIKDDFDF